MVRRASSYDIVIMMTIAVPLLQAKTRGGRLALLVINENTTTGALPAQPGDGRRSRAGRPARVRGVHAASTSCRSACAVVSHRSTEAPAQPVRCRKPAHRVPRRPTPRASAAAGFYTGNEEAFLPSNVLFRMGGAACLMSTRCALEPPLAASGRPHACMRRSP
jgi:hypothetical protein